MRLAFNAASAIERTRPWIPTAIVLSIALAIRAMCWMQDDVSWFLTLAERVLDGARPYIDFVDGNPPAAFLAYMPAAIAARISGVRPEAIVTVFVFAAALSSIALAAAVLLRQRLIESREAKLLLPFAVACLLIVPGNTFAQREHLALIALLPMLAVYCVRADRGDVPFLAAVAAGVGGGLALAFKPYFAFPIALTFFAVLMRVRPTARGAIRLIASAENLGALGTALVYLCLCVIAYPAYFDRAVPLALDLYTQFNLPVARLVLSYASLFTATGLSLCLLAWGTRLWRHPALIFLCAAIGFAVCTFVQAKLYPYHSAPALILLLFVAGWGVLVRLPLVSGARPVVDFPVRARVVAIVLLYAAVLTADLFYFGFSFHPPKLAPEIARLAPRHPRIASITDSMVGTKLARILGGTWVEPTPSSWIGQYAAGDSREYAFAAPAISEQMKARAAFERMDLDLFVKAIEVGKPDIIVVQPDAFSRMRLAEPRVVDAMANYRLAEVYDGAFLWLRKQKRSAVPGARA